MSAEQIELMLKYLARLTPRGREEEREILWLMRSLETRRVPLRR